MNKFTLIYLQGFYSWLRIFRDTSLSILVFVNKSCCLLKFFIDLYVLSWLFIKISFLSLCWLFSAMQNIACSNLEVKLKQKWFWDLLLLGVFKFLNRYFFLLLWSIYLLPGTVHSSTQQFTLHLAPLLGAKVRSGWLEGWFWKLNYQDLFESFCSNPITTLHATQE